MKFYHGVSTAIITPFKNDKINFSEFEKLVDFQLENGVKTILFNGTTGEPSTMTKSEKEDVLRFAVEMVGGNGYVLAGTGGNNTREVVQMTEFATNLGCHGILAVTPYYNKCTQNGIVTYYERICSSTSLPVIGYNVPGRTGVNISSEACQRLNDVKGFAAIKEASGNLGNIQDVLSVAKNFDVISGDDALALPILAIGGKGVISVSSNVVPKEMCQMVDFALSGDFSKALDLHNRILPLLKGLFVEVNPIPVKMAMNYLGFDTKEIREPLTVLEDANCEKLRKIMTELSLLEEKL